MNILVTGGAGFLGSVLVPELLRAGHTVRVLDRFMFGDGSLHAIVGHEKLSVRRGDVRRLQEIDGLFDGTDLVVHLAAVSDEASCALDEDAAFEVNVAASRELAGKAAQFGVRRFVLASCLPHETDAPILTHTKLEAERAILALHTGDFEVIVVRLAPLYGVAPRLRLDSGPNRTCVVQDTGPWRGAALSVNHAASAIRRVIKNSPVDSPINVYEAAGSAGDSDVVFGSELETALSEVKASLNSIDTSSSRYHNAKRLAELRAISVDQGGEPAAPRFIPLARPMLGPEEDEAVLEAFRSGWLTSGPQIAAFEKAFARTVGAKHAVAVVSCTAALHLCLVHAGVGPGDEVITSPITWASTGNTILNMGARVVFADVESDTLNIDPAAIERAITPRTKVIMPVHLAGQPADMRAINAIAAKHGITVVEDAAHALGAAYDGAPIGSGPNFACFSFYAIKNITTMEGGAITMHDPAAAQHLRLLAANGMTATAWDRYGRSATPGPAMVAEPGYKYLLGNVNAAIGLKQLDKFPEFKRRRAELAALYLELLRDVSEARPLAIRADRVHAWHLMIVRLDLARLGITRDEVMAALRRENIGTGLHFYGLHLHPYYRDVLRMRPEELPNATAASNDIVSLPLYPGMTDADVRHVVDALKKVAASSKSTTNN